MLRIPFEKHAEYFWQFMNNTTRDAHPNKQKCGELRLDK